MSKITHRTTVDLDDTKDDIVCVETELATGAKEETTIKRSYVKKNNLSMLQFVNEFKNQYPHHHVIYRNVAPGQERVMWDSECDVNAEDRSDSDKDSDFECAMSIL
jgi:hypothetical protein